MFECIYFPTVGRCIGRMPWTLSLKCEMSINKGMSLTTGFMRDTVISEDVKPSLSFGLRVSIANFCTAEYVNGNIDSTLITTLFSSSNYCCSYLLLFYYWSREWKIWLGLKDKNHLKLLPEAKCECRDLLFFWLRALVLNYNKLKERDENLTYIYILNVFC